MEFYRRIRNERESFDSQCRTCRNKKNREDAPKHAYRYRLKAVYGLTLGEHQAMFEKQGGRCALCDTPQSRFKRRLAVDHDHATGRFRGLLCGRCNTVIGLLEENPQLISRIARRIGSYLLVPVEASEGAGIQLLLTDPNREAG